MKQAHMKDLIWVASQARVVLDTVLEKFQPQFKTKRETTGGYFILADGLSGLPEFSMFLGQLPDERAAEVVHYAAEKARRLAVTSLEESHHLSWQSRDPDLNRWGGAVFFHDADKILSFSGFPELWDEAAMLALGVRLFDASSMDIFGLARISDNPHIGVLARGLGLPF